MDNGTTPRERAIPIISGELRECFPASLSGEQCHQIAKAALNALSDDPDLLRALAGDDLGERYQDGYTVGFGEGRATTYPQDERRGRLVELSYAHDLALARGDCFEVAKLLADRIALLRTTEKTS